MVALGAVNLAAGLFQGFRDQRSSSRTPVAEAAGAKTQLTGVVGAAVVALLLVAAPNLLQDLPNAALAAVVIAAVIGCSSSPTSAGSGASSGGSSGSRSRAPSAWLVFGAIQGIMIALAIAIGEFLWDGWRPPARCSGASTASTGSTTWRAIPRRGWCRGWCCSAGRRRCSSPTPSCSTTELQAAIAASPTPVKRVIVTAEPVTSIDVTANDALVELEQALTAPGIELCFAELKDRVKDKLARFGSLAELGEENILRDRRRGGRALHRGEWVQWIDWEDRK